MTPSLSTMVTEGANRVGERGADPKLPAAAFVAAIALASLAFRVRSARARVSILAAAAAAMAFPGLATIAGQRSDSPARAVAAAATIERFRDQVESFAEAHGCARVVASACVACEPVVDFALATERACDAASPIILGPDSLSEGCAEAASTLICGRGSAR